QGVLPGEYHVSVVKHVPKTPADAKKLEQMKAKENPDRTIETDGETDNEPVKSGQPEYKNSLPDKLANPRTSGIEITIAPEGNRNMTIEIKP
ncbi:MAG: hypothetical protein LBH00_06485, partial [Planctomycetaceae bacterium]|nr:hypothetical protein [Planctomycetaceae bacterium]